MLDEVSPDYEDFSDWFAALVQYARQEDGHYVAKLVRRSAIIYREYYLQGLQPQRAFAKEWR